eukprot:GHVS01066371.1.p1 GENE.GHVS01066371.1~~GHVS01066371.1.p1  ORF type:complete len:199 (+),score=18.57 GHVS01066371.1:214-810(+)
MQSIPTNRLSAKEAASVFKTLSPTGDYLNRAEERKATEKLVKLYSKLGPLRQREVELWKELRQKEENNSSGISQTIELFFSLEIQLILLDNVGPNAMTALDELELIRTVLKRDMEALEKDKKIQIRDLPQMRALRSAVNELSDRNGPLTKEFTGEQFKNADYVLGMLTEDYGAAIQNDGGKPKTKSPSTKRTNLHATD